MKNNLKNVILIIIFTTLFTGCNRGEYLHYTWTTDIELKYSDNTKDTITHSITLMYDAKPKFYISRRYDATCLMCYKVLACDVRHFKIINQTKTGYGTKLSNCFK